MEYTDDMTVEEAAKKINKERVVKKPSSKPKKENKKDWRDRAIDKLESVFPFLEKIEKAGEKSTGSESIRKKVYPKKK